jgi:anthranilate synthase component 1
MGGLYRQRLTSPPDLLALAQAYPDDFPFLLESSADSPLGRYSMLLLAGKEVLTAGPEGLEPGVFTGALKDHFRRERIEFDPRDSDIPFRGGWFLYFGYEMAAAVEPTLDLPANPTGLPDALACRCPGAIIVFHGDCEHRAEVIAESSSDRDRILRKLDNLPKEAHPAAIPSETTQLGTIQEGDAADFLAGVRRIHEYLLSGDVFQVNLSRSWQAQLHTPCNALDVYRALRAANPAPFSGVMQWRDLAVLSSSPERLLELRRGIAQTRPIADPGSVEVDELMVIESYAHVHHIVSNVRGRLRDDADPIDALTAVFPGGTITGCPKVRCMEIIAELEREGRGFYTGSMGYLCRDGDLDMNILIRSMLLDGDNISFRTGAGIVADSVPEKELDETSDKARGLLLAITG